MSPADAELGARPESPAFAGGVARRMWQALEPYHAVTYFVPESRRATDRLGLKGGWMSYFGLRAAPLGAAPAGLVGAVFYNFHPNRVGRAIPAAWQAATPSALVEARRRSVDEALRRVLGDAVGSAELAEAAELARRAAMAAPLDGRVLAAANAALPWPSEPHLVLWHAQTLLRESRGDAHVAALVCARLDPCEALVTFAADGRAVADELREFRGWSVEEWADARSRLVRRGLLDPAGALTADGAELRAWVEERTDLAAVPSWAELGPESCERLVSLTRPLVSAIIDGGAFMSNNPMGLKPLP
ncbi:hypothetical protein GCM10023321_35400 [Pseudonocardia eucalypti]|uniref:SalK n=1 Tax=Pseudonocardia eucalypti TaxID=648755 RepID=A0ABP9Q8J9_9PSEU|nr:hypothetical protein [Pseudonocardia eucalypti]